VVGVDVGIVHFLTSSTGKEYGSFHGKMARRHKRDRAKRRRKAKLRACLEKKGVRKREAPLDEFGKLATFEPSCQARDQSSRQ
jgi:transposase